LKFGLSSLAIALLVATSMQPSFAKEHRAHRAGSASKSPSAQDDKPKGANPADSQAKETSDAPVTVSPPRDPSVKREMPLNLQTRRAPVPAPQNPVPRNSIGEIAAPHESMTVIDGRRLSSAAPAPVLGAIGPPHPGPVVSVTIPSRGKVDGAGLIRPFVALTGLGGPAKVVVGINGTTLRSKR
jgi:hypothetical protein